MGRLTGSDKEGILTLQGRNLRPYKVSGRDLIRLGGVTLQGRVVINDDMIEYDIPDSIVSLCVELAITPVAEQKYIGGIRRDAKFCVSTMAAAITTVQQKYDAQPPCRDAKFCVSTTTATTTTVQQKYDAQPPCRDAKFCVSTMAIPTTIITSTI